MIYHLLFRRNRQSSIVNRQSQSGFTLIELLIVIVIIGVLATILLANFIGVRQRARDAQRKADLRQIQGAIELYKADQGVYPQYPLYQNSTGNCSSNTNSLTYLQTGAPIVTYMQKIPCDPLPPSTGFLGSNYGYYLYSFNGINTYNLYACIENLNDLDPNARPSNVLCKSGANRKTYTLTNP